MAVSNWFLYIGIFLCASGIGLVVGAIFIAYWGIKTLQESKYLEPTEAGVEYTGCGSTDTTEVER